MAGAAVNYEPGNTGVPEAIRPVTTEVKMTVQACRVSTCDAHDGWHVHQQEECVGWFTEMERWA